MATRRSSVLWTSSQLKLHLKGTHISTGRYFDVLASGTLYSKANAIKNCRNVLVYQNVCYRCVHYGEISSKATTVNSRSLRTGGAARFNMRLDHGRLVPGKAVMDHYHPADVSKAAKCDRNLRLT